MSQVGWVIEGKRYSHAEAMAYARTYPDGLAFGADLLDQMYQANLRTYISPTMFSGCVRAEVLKRETDYWLDPAKAWPLLRGTVAHLIMERGAHEPDAVLETSLSCEVKLLDGRTVTLKGTPDKVVPSQRLLVDYKSIDVVTDTPKDYWIAQLSCYRWMLAQHEIPIDRAYIQQISMKTTKRLWLDLWPLDKAERYIQERAAKFAGVVDGTYTLENLPAPFNFTLEADSTWQCGPLRNGDVWCAVQQQCMARLRLDMENK